MSETYVDPDDDGDQDPGYLAATRAQRRRQWESECARWGTKPQDGNPPPWLAQPRKSA